MREPVETRLRIPPEIQGVLRGAIASAGGNEVFFLARVSWERDGSRRVATLEDVEVVARGGASAVPAILERAEAWDLALHNHPSGDLEPSDADIGVAAELGSRNVGFAIISNDATRHYLVAGPFEKPEPEPVEASEVEAIFAPDGPLSRSMDGFECRPGQLEMALEVARALNENRVVALEAGTGVGKSFAYLVPAVLWAVKNKERVVVSTGTINLQEQLVGKDLPFLRSVLPVEFDFALAKGRSNYACLRKVEELQQDLRENLIQPPEEERRMLEDLIAWAGSTSEGSRSDLTWEPPEDLWELVMSETDKSLKVACKHYDRCFYYRAKRRASTARVIVVNHHLFFADLAVRRQTENFLYDAVIPVSKRVIFDEAHHLEDVAAQYFGVNFTRGGLLLRLSKLLSPDNPQRGTIAALARRLRGLGDSTAAEAIEPPYQVCIPEVAKRLEGHFAAIEEALLALPGEKSSRGGESERSGNSEAEAEGQCAESGAESRQVRYRPDSDLESFWHAVSTELEGVRDALSAVLQVNDRAVGVLKRSSIDPERQAGMLLELMATSSRLQAVLEQIDLFREYRDATQVRWISRRPSSRARARAILEFGSAPIRVGRFLKELYDSKRTVVLTSATLAVAGKPDFIADRLGLSLLEEDRFRFRVYPSPFDFRRQVLVVVPEDLPPPDSPQFSQRVPDAVFRLLQASGGRAFVLFTSYRLLQRTYDALRDRLEGLGLRPGYQGEVGRTELLSRFRSGAINVLFGTDSFWEGVDVKGRPLECVIITRLPFRVPTEPIQEARLEDLEASGINPFYSYTVPQAVLRFKQGFGRLIRSKTDRGVVAILDRRIFSKSYGRAFLMSLPETRVSKGTVEEIAREVAAFFPEDTLFEGDAEQGGGAFEDPEG